MAIILWILFFLSACSSLESRVRKWSAVKNDVRNVCVSDATSLGFPSRRPSIQASHSSRYS